MIMAFVQVAAAEGAEELELPLEEDKTLLLSTLSAQFPNACSLKYKTNLGKNRGVRTSGNRLYPPSSDGWGNSTYYCVFANVSDSVWQLTCSEANISTTSSLSSYAITEKYRLRSQLNEQSTSSQSAFAKMRIKREPTSSSTTSNFLSSTLQKINCSKSLTSTSDVDYNVKMEQISATMAELKNAYKQKLMYDFIMKSYHELVFDKPGALPKHITRHCERNILREKVGYFLYPNNVCNRELYEAVFAAPLPTEEEPLNIKDARVLQEKLFELVAKKSQVATDSISEIEAYDFAELLKPQPMKPGTIFTDEQLFIMSKSQEIKSTHDKCKEMTSHIKDLLGELCDYRQTVHPRLNKKIVDCLKTQAELVEKDARCFNAEIIGHIREQNPFVIEALQQLSNYLNDSVNKKAYEVAKLKEQRAAYDKVKGEKFSEMVEKYQKLVERINTQIALSKMYGVESPSYISDRSYIESDDD